MVGVIDFVPTALDLAGHKTVTDTYKGRKVFHPSGKSLAPLLANPNSSVRNDTDIYAMEMWGYRSVYKGDYKFYGWYDGTKPFDANDLALYNLKDDPSEKHDLSTKEPEKFKELIKTKKANLTTFHKALKETQHTLIQFFTTFLIGEGVLIPSFGEVAATPAVFLGFHIDKKSKNPYTLSKVSLRFAISDSRKVMNYKCSGEQEMMLYGIEKKSESLSQEEKQNILLDWNELVKNTSAKRQKRHILTQNIVGASNRIGSLNRLIKYNTTTGEIKNGIFMHIDYGKEGEDKKSFYPISDAYQYIQALEENEFFADHQLNVRFKRLGGALYELAIRKAGNFEMFTNKDIRSLLERAEGKSEDELPDFVQNANEMVGVIHEKKIEPLLHLLDDFDLSFLGETRPLEPWEIENEKAWKEETKESNELWVYQLNKAFGQASYPAVGFKGHQDNNAPEAPFGVLTYSRPLTDKEKYSYSLIPMYQNVAQPYQAWKKHIASSEALSKEWMALIAKMKDQPTEVAMDELGFFIFHNAHEEGRTPFVFGLYDRQDYGRIAYQEEIGEIVSLKELIQKLTIELNISG